MPPAKAMDEFDKHFMQSCTYLTKHLDDPHISQLATKIVWMHGLSIFINPNQLVLNRVGNILQPRYFELPNVYQDIKPLLEKLGAHKLSREFFIAELHSQSKKNFLTDFDSQNRTIACVQQLADFEMAGAALELPGVGM